MLYVTGLYAVGPDIASALQVLCVGLCSLGPRPKPNSAQIVSLSVLRVMLEVIYALGERSGNETEAV